MAICECDCCDECGNEDSVDGAVRVCQNPPTPSALVSTRAQTATPAVLCPPVVASPTSLPIPAPRLPLLAGVAAAPRVLSVGGVKVADFTAIMREMRKLETGDSIVLALGDEGRQLEADVHQGTMV